jgi:uncharacterized membrane protein
MTGPQRTAVLLAVTACCLTACAGTAAASVVVAALQDADSGGADPGDPSPWRGAMAIVAWVVVGLGGVGLLAWIALGASRRDAARPADEPDEPPESRPDPPEPPAATAEPDDDGNQDITALTFDHVEGAERAYADVRGRAGDAPWMHEMAFVECHRNGRIVVRGVFAGHYVSVDDLGDAIGQDTAAGAAAGALVGLAFGPAGMAAGLVAGGSAGGMAEARHAPQQRGRLFDEIRADVPPGSSGLVALTGTRDADALVHAFRDRPSRVTRHHLSPDDAAALVAAVSGSPMAAPVQPRP